MTEVDQGNDARVLGSPAAPSPTADREPDPPHIHRVIDNSIPAALTIESGEIVVFDCPGLPLPEYATVEDVVARIDPDRPHTIVGPVEINDATPGDTLVVEILDIELSANHGHTPIIPGEGLLGQDFETPHVHNFTWTDGATSTELRPGVKVPLNPFCGILGVMPEAAGEHSTLPPRAIGGNLDVRHLVPGTTLYLPVEVPGALFFAGDGHGAQGDGEVCVTGLETSVRATLRLSVDRERKVKGPEFHTFAPLSVDAGTHGYYATSAVGPDLYECSQNAIRHMINRLIADHDLPWEEALILCSLVADLKINEIVDRPNWLVSAYVPMSIFAEAG
jgi:acetamidase/formamidase